jgi:hypothetical protein
MFTPIAVLAMFACSDDDKPVAPPEPPPPAVDLFSGAYAIENWTNSGILDGTTSIDPASGEPTTAAFSYNVPDAGCYSGREFRTTTFEVPVPTSGVVTFDWVYTGFHAWYQANAFLRFFVDGEELLAVNRQTVSGTFTLSGSATITVSGPGTFGIEIGGKNYDTDCTLRGTLTITNTPTP